MRELDHWHPVLLSRALDERPKAVALHGRSIVLFRARSGDVGALVDRCPHRGMLLSKGWVEEGRLVCQYHGWSYDARGNGFTEATPGVNVCAEHFEVKERHGAIWIRRPGANTELPSLSRSGFTHLISMCHRIERPLELVLDNFVEVEHTATTHWLLGYARDALPSVKTDVEATETSVRVVNRGKQKHMPALLKKLFDVREGDDFIDDWTTYFSPVYSVYSQYWVDPRSDERRRDVLLTAAFFVPRSTATTDIFTFISVNDVPRPLPDMLVKPVLQLIADREVRRDQKMIESLSPDVGASLDGFKLGRFDAVLRQNRKRLESIYRGR